MTGHVRRLLQKAIGFLAIESPRGFVLAKDPADMDDVTLFVVVSLALLAFYASDGNTAIGITVGDGGDADQPPVEPPPPGDPQPQPPTSPPVVDPPPANPIASGTDAIDLAGAEIHGSPDVRNWPITLGLSVVREGENLRLLFDREVPQSWVWPNGGPVGDNFQYTIWAVVVLNGQVVAAGFLQRWQGLDPAFESPLSNWINWWGPDGSATGGVFGGYVPSPGDVIGIMVTAGNARAFTSVSSVAERSNVATVAL